MFSPLLHMAALSFFFYVFPTRSKLHALPIAIYILLHLQSVSSLCKLGDGVHAHTPPGTAFLWG